MRVVPQAAVDFIKREEACKLDAYQDSAGVWTIGYGHTRDVAAGQVISQAQADDYLAEDLGVAGRGVERLVKADVLAKLTDNQYAAIVSFAFNLGADPSFGIWALLNSGQLDRVPSRMLLYNKARVAGALVVVKGLTNRRMAEAALWEDGQGVDVVVTARTADTPPTPIEPKPLSLSKRLWTGVCVALAGLWNLIAPNLQWAANAAHELQDVIAPQSQYSDFLKHLQAGVAVFIVIAGAAVVLFQVQAHQEAKS